MQCLWAFRLGVVDLTQIVFRIFLSFLAPSTPCCDSGSTLSSEKILQFLFDGLWETGIVLPLDGILLVPFGPHRQRVVQVLPLVGDQVASHFTQMIQNLLHDSIKANGMY